MKRIKGTPDADKRYRVMEILNEIADLSKAQEAAFKFYKGKLRPFRSYKDGTPIQEPGVRPLSSSGVNARSGTSTLRNSRGETTQFEFERDLDSVIRG